MRKVRKIIRLAELKNLPILASFFLLFFVVLFCNLCCIFIGEGEGEVELTTHYQNLIGNDDYENERACYSHNT